MDVAEGWKTRPSQFLSRTPNSKTARTGHSMVSSEVQMHKSEGDARQKKEEIRRYRSW